MSPFVKAVKEQSKLRLAISSPAGFGKTYTALRIGRRLAEHAGGRVALIDTEHKSASKYAHKFDFDSVELHAPFTPERYITLIQQAEAAGYPVLIIDSASHEWNGAGGCLEMVDAAAKRFGGNKWSAWSEVTPKHNRFVETILASGMHIIATYRSKVETQQVEQGGQKKIVKLGMEAIAREGTEYEFDVVGEIDAAHNMAITKTRCEDLTDRAFSFPGEDVADILIAWLTDGAPIEPVLAPAEHAQLQQPAPSQPTQPAPAQPAPPAGPTPDEQAAAELEEWGRQWVAKMMSASPRELKGKARTDEVNRMRAHLVGGGVPEIKLGALCKLLHETATAEQLPENTPVSSVLDARLVLALGAVGTGELYMLSRIAKSL